MKKILFSIMAAMSVMPSMAQSKTATTRDERNYIVEGNKLYNEQRYADAEVAYRKALQENAMNEIAQFNLAASLLRQGSASGETQKEASAILQNLTRDAENISIAEKAFYNLGNIAFNSQDYAKSIELYKNALRKNPDNDKARENLRLAQKRLEDQQKSGSEPRPKSRQAGSRQKDQDKQDQNKNQNQNNDQNKDDKKTNSNSSQTENRISSRSNNSREA